MYHIQAKLLDIAKHQKLGGLSFRQIADLLGVPGKAQIAKHHLLQLKKAGLVRLDFKAGIIEPIGRGYHTSLLSSKF